MQTRAELNDGFEKREVPRFKRTGWIGVSLHNEITQAAASGIRAS
jgi:hypothetical protein